MIIFLSAVGATAYQPRAQRSDALGMARPKDSALKGRGHRTDIDAALAGTMRSPFRARLVGLIVPQGVLPWAGMLQPFQGAESSENQARCTVDVNVKGNVT